MLPSNPLRRRNLRRREFLSFRGENYEVQHTQSCCTGNADLLHLSTPTLDCMLHHKFTANRKKTNRHRCCKRSGGRKIAGKRQWRTLRKLSTWKAGGQRAGRVRGKTQIPLCVFLSCFFSRSLFTHREVCTLVLEFWVEAWTTQLLEDNLSPLILSAMWWHSLTSTICWNTSRSSQHRAVSRTPLPCPITDRLLGGSLLPGGRDKDTVQRRGRHTRM